MLPPTTVTPEHKNDLLGTFARHRVACNLLMAMMILAGLWALTRLNTQFFPNFALDFISVRITWTGSSAEDVEDTIVNPLEQALRAADGLRQMTSTASEGGASVSLEYEEGTDMGVALDWVKEQVALVRNLPDSSDEPEITRIVRYEPVARVLVTGPADLQPLRPLIRSMERELLSLGIAKVDVTGLPEEEIAIQVSASTLRALDMSLDGIARRISVESRDLPAGTVGRNNVARQLRALGQRRSEIEFEQLPLISDDTGRLVTVGDVARVERRPQNQTTRLFRNGQPAVELHIKRAENTDSLESARTLSKWKENIGPQLPDGVEVEIYDEAWRLIRERIFMLLKNGAGGLVLVVLILYLFLNGRVAFWVAAGIPISFMATLGVLYAVGGSINMVSLFALIMTLGIIVDDAIVVGENALAQYQSGVEPLLAAEGGGRRMLAPVLASSLTTIAAFMPLMLVGGIIGNILFDIPTVVICVIAASLVESFLILPGHLRQSFQHLHLDETSATRRRLEAAVDGFRERIFRPMVAWATVNPSTILAAAVAMLMLSAGLFAGGRLVFQFFPATEGTVLQANVSFVSGTPPERVEAYMGRLQDSLRQTEASFGEELVRMSVVRLGSYERLDGRRSLVGNQYAGLFVELEAPDRRNVRNGEFLKAWRERVPVAPGIESLAIIERRGGPPGRDIDIRLTGSDAAAIKAAALELSETLKSIAGVVGVDDDMPYGRQQLIFSLTPEGRSLGLTVEEVGDQLRAAYDGKIAQIFQDGDDEVEVRVMLPDDERHNLLSLENFGLVLASGESVPLPTVVQITTRRGFETLRHLNGQLAVRISGDVDPAITTNDKVINSVKRDILPVLKQRYGIDYVFEGRRADQEETLGDMKVGGLFALGLIYLVLAWVFASYGWPLVVMSAIPFGLVGALLGHWAMGIDLTILSLFGFFGLSGIVVNDSIILVIFYKELIEGGEIGGNEAIVEAACQRLRAVLLTSLTTIAGLTPLLFEKSLQAQFLIPMAVSISFGLAFATMIVLIMIPALLCIHESVAERLRGGRVRSAVGGPAARPV
jgi:multidrug efflux pump subunit AcrB